MPPERAFPHEDDLDRLAVWSKAAHEARASVADLPPVLLVIIDTEEEFDWSRSLSRDNVSVEAMRGQAAAQGIFARYGIVPTYVVDYPIATTPSSIGILRTFLEREECLIGAHLHPWVNPPFVEEVNPFNSYAGNLPPRIEHEKLARLTEAIEINFRLRPVIYKAGRYGLGGSTPATLERLGYRIDASVVPYTSFAADGGPDFGGFSFHPFFFGSSRNLLEIPLSCGFCGALAPFGTHLYRRLFSGSLPLLRLPGACARLRLLERIRLTPEGVSLAEQKRLVRALLRSGCRIFSYVYHSPSLVPGHTPYVRDRRDLRAFLGDLDRFFDFFINEIGGEPATPVLVYDRLTRGRP